MPVSCANRKETQRFNKITFLSPHKPFHLVNPVDRPETIR